MKDTKNLYTKNSKTVIFPSGSNEKLAEIKWEPGTHEALCKFPDGPRGTLGYYLYLVQKGEVPPTSTPVPGFSDLFELRDEDAQGWYRLIHLKRKDDKIYVVHCFEKQSNQIEKRDLRTIQSRVGRLNRRLMEEGRNAKRGKKR